MKYVRWQAIRASELTATKSPPHVMVSHLFLQPSTHIFLPAKCYPSPTAGFKYHLLQIGTRGSEFLTRCFEKKDPKLFSQTAYITFHGLINNIDIKATSSTKFTCKGILRQVFIRGDRRKFRQSIGIFDPALRTVAPLTFSLVLLSSPFPLSQYSRYRQCSAGRGQEVLSPVGDHILQKFITPYLTRFITNKIARPFQIKSQVSIQLISPCNIPSHTWERESSLQNSFQQHKINRTVYFNLIFVSRRCLKIFSFIIIVPDPEFLERFSPKNTGGGLIGKSTTYSSRARAALL